MTTFSRCLLIQIGAFVMREGDRATVKRMSCLLQGCQFLMAATLGLLDFVFLVLLVL